MSQTQSESPARKKASNWSCSFEAEWLENAKYSSWLSKKDDLTDECIVCRQTFPVKYEGRGAVDSHGKSVKHAKAISSTKVKSNVLQLFYCAKLQDR